MLRGQDSSAILCCVGAATVEVCGHDCEIVGWVDVGCPLWWSVVIKVVG